MLPVPSIGTPVKEVSTEDTVVISPSLTALPKELSPHATKPKIMYEQARPPLVGVMDCLSRIWSSGLTGAVVF